MDLAVHNRTDFMPALSMTDKVRALQDFLLKLPQAEIVTEHVFKPGVYERKITIPPWTVLTGAEHKTAYRVRLEKGRIAVNTDDEIKVLEAPCEFDVNAGAQRAGRVFEDEVVWVDIYNNPDDCTDLAVLEDRLYVAPECGLADSRTDEQKVKIAQDAKEYWDKLAYDALVDGVALPQLSVELLTEGESSWLDG